MKIRKFPIHVLSDASQGRFRKNEALLYTICAPFAKQAVCWGLFNFKIYFSMIPVMDELKAGIKALYNDSAEMLMGVWGKQ